MSDDSTITVRIEPALYAGFMAAAEAAALPVSQLICDLMRDYVRQQGDRREYSAFMQQKVDSARVFADAGIGRNNDEVAAEFAARAARTARQA